MSLLGAHSVEIRALTEGRDGSAAKTRSWASSGTSLSCTVHPASTRDVTRAMQDGYEVSHKIFFESDPGSNAGDLILWKGRRLYQVGKVIHRDESADLAYYRVMAMEQESRQQES